MELEVRPQNMWSWPSSNKPGCSAQDVTISDSHLCHITVQYFEILSCRRKLWSGHKYPWLYSYCTKAKEFFQSLMSETLILSHKPECFRTPRRVIMVQYTFVPACCIIPPSVSNYEPDTSLWMDTNSHEWMNERTDRENASRVPLIISGGDINEKIRKFYCWYIFVEWWHMLETVVQ